MSEPVSTGPQTAIAQNHRQIAEAVLICVQQRLAPGRSEGEASVLIWGTLDAAATRWLLRELNAHGSRVRFVHAAGSTEELRDWETQFASLLPGAELKTLDVRRDVLDQDLAAGAFDVVAATDLLPAAQTSFEFLANLKRLLKREGLLILELAVAPEFSDDARLAAQTAQNGSDGSFARTPARPPDTSQWKAALARAGFHGLIARSDRRPGKSALERDIIIARSDGRVEIETATPPRPGGALRDSAAIEPSRPANGRSAQPDLEPSSAPPGPRQPRTDQPPATPADQEAIREAIVKTLGRLLQISPEDLDATSAFTEYGVDSIAGVAFVNQLNRQLGVDLKPMVLFDYASVEKLTAYIAAQGRPPLAAGATAADGDSGALKLAGTSVADGEPSPTPAAPPGPEHGGSDAPPARRAAIAVIGISGRFPGAANIDQFWQNLAQGKNCITEVPRERWDHSKFFERDTRRTDKTNSNWGGFLADADKFDPLFFNISGRESEATDPQHRLFLEACYHALEDAGYVGPSAGIAKKCGVFAGVEPGDYLQLLLRSEWPQENAPVFQGNAESILAARISYFLDLKGPSIAINTACSSSLVAVHLACQSLVNGDCDLALAGGVRVFTSEKAYLALGNMGMLSPDGRCKTFDEGADGFVPGEAVGVVVLKTLAAALRDGDHIYGVIKGSAVNQDGKTNGITAPSSLSQTQVELEVYEKFGIPPQTIQYVEAHGTGTKLGDPIEVQALTQAFRQFTPVKGFCAIGSVKTNIGHTMAAAGVCAMIKVLLALRHRQIPPSLNLVKPNPYIDFANSPFFVNTALREWNVEPGRPRRAAISSFGFSGTNCHLVVEEAITPVRRDRAPAKPAYLVTVSAKTAEALQQRLHDLVEWMKGDGGRSGLEDVSFTLNVGRSHFAARCAAVASASDELVETLTRLAKGEKTSAGWRAESREGESGETAIYRQVLVSVLKELPAAAADGAATYREKLAALGALYVKGHEIDWARLHAGEAHRRIPLPTYPFARERYWVAEAVTGAPGNRTEPARLHPLVHRNTSTLGQTQFASLLDERDFFLNDHQINGQKVLPGVAYLELAAAAIRLATGSDAFVLANVAWTRPLRVEGEQAVSIRLVDDDGSVRFEVVSDADAAVHAEGKAVLNRVLSPRRVDVAAIKARCPQSESGAAVYQRCGDAGLSLGQSFQTIREIWFAEHEALSRLELPAALVPSSSAFTLHPSLLDGALQTTAILGGGEGAGLPVPFAVGEVAFTRLTPVCYAHVVQASGNRGLRRFSITLMDESGEVLAELKDLAMRPYRPEPDREHDELLFVKPLWREQPLVPEAPAWPAGKLLLFDATETFAGALRRHGSGLDVVRVVPGRGFEAQGDLIAIDPERAEDYERLLRSVQPDFVIHRWAAPTEETAEALQRSILSLFHLTRAFIRSGVQARIPLLFAHPPNGHPAFPAVSAYARTLRLERPNLWLKVVETGESDPARLVAELSQLDGESEIRYRDGSREVKALEVFSPAPAKPLPLREHGVYLITGGAGGLGLIFADYLARQYRARLVLLGRSELAPERRARLTALEALGAEVLYVRADVASLDEVSAAVRTSKERFGRIDGVIHAAGVLQDGFLLHKEPEQFRAVLSPKVAGVIALDEATRDEPIEFFVLFSSLAAVLGNVGQSDYGYANGFLDEFARWREERRARGERTGRTLSLNWPLWRDGGMRQTEELDRARLAGIGISLLTVETGLKIFESALRSNETQIMPLWGQAEKIRALLLPPEPPVARAATSAPTEWAPDFRERWLRHLTEQFSKLIKIPAARIQAREPLEKYGIDSIMVMEFTRELEKDFGELSKTLLFEHQTLAEVANYFLASHPERLTALMSDSATRAAGVENSGTHTLRRKASPPAPVQPPMAQSTNNPAVAAAPGVTAGGATLTAPRPAGRSPVTAPNGDDIAIIGVFGRYPMADDLDQFWDNLQSGKDCIVEIPKERWDCRLFYDPEPGKPGKTPNKWGGFLKDVDKFDPRFFNITPREAIVLDPQERLFLETVWRTVEDAGYRKSALANRKVGVFVGVMYGEYQLYGAGDIEQGVVFPLSSSYASIANRVSYFFNWRGPSLAVDTMCSSSLTSIHLACESLRRGESELAVAGGVNATLHPHKDILLSPGGFAASDGRCRSFGAGGDGYVPGEGVGAVLLKPLACAVADGDHIYAVIKASAVNHGGKTNGYTVPNPKAQAELIHEALAEANIDPRTIGCIEAHGTGTSLGDPIEISGLTKAFRELAGKNVLERHYCAIGSVKSNIGHLESAAGIAGVTKVLLQMRHHKLVPSLHSEQLNPNIGFQDSPFRVQQSLQDWAPIEIADEGGRRTFPRRAGISSFGAGGANAHLILEEYVAPAVIELTATARDGVSLLVFSARNADRLRARARQLHDALLKPESDTFEAITLEDIAYTLQVGREAFDERLAFVAVTRDEVIRKLHQFLAGEKVAGLFHGSLRPRDSESLPLLEGEEGRAFVEAIIRNRRWDKLAQFWVAGGDVDWDSLYRESAPRRVPLPTYPFAGERYWAPDHLRLAPGKAGSEARLHPSVPRKVSDVEAQGDVTKEPATRDLAPQETPAANFYRPVWRETQPPLARQAGTLKGTLLLFDAEPDLARQAGTETGELSIVRVAPGESFTDEPGLMRINPRQDADYQRLIESVRPDFIVHRWSRAGQDLDTALEDGIYSVFRLARALILSVPKSEVRLLYVCPTENQPAFAAVGAFARTLVQEQPRLQLRTLETDEFGPAMLSELLADDRQPEVRWHDGKREVRTFERFAAATAAPAPLRERGIYLITGGLGGLGLIFAEHLARTYQARLVLTGRSALTDAGRTRIAGLESLGAEVLHVRGDISQRDDADTVVRQARERFGSLHGVIHAAGLIRDAFILKKETADFAEVLAPKVRGLVALDAATRDEDLDFLVLFSSTAGALGNAGQSDYAYANGFMDAFARVREARRLAGLCQGRTVAINWPFWSEGGMKLAGEEAQSYLEQIGLFPLSREVGILLFEAALRSDEAQVMPLWGITSKLERNLFAVGSTETEGDLRPVSGVDDVTLTAKLEQYLKQILAEVTHLPVDEIDSDARFEELGVDSIVVSDFNLRIGKDLGALPKTLLFEQPNLGQLAGHLVAAYKSQLARFFGAEGSSEAVTPPRAEQESHREQPAPESRSSAPAGRSPASNEDIAIVGLAGRYPQADDLEAFWENLKSGRDCVTEIPKDRWDIDRFFDPDPNKAAEGRMYCRWGAFLDDVDKFDPLFFNIAPLEAEVMDPQERLFLETAWAALEDAGYTRHALSRLAHKEYAANVGVFVGVTTNTYLCVARDNGGDRAVPTSLPWSIANRVSYLFNFNGPSMPVDTACSSSLTAIHLACEAIRKGECRQAIAGGVNLYLHPSKYVSLCLMRMLSTAGKCRTFGAGGDGFVPGEGVGAVLLKPLSQAVQDGDHIYGVIKGTALNHGGRTNGYTVPNPNAQADLIAQALKAARVDPRTLSYVEAHGTGTALGDPIEVAGLTKAFHDGIEAHSADLPRHDAGRTAPFCSLGSVKSNIGHLEAAAGIAGLTKVLLQMKHRQLAPSLNAEPLNPNISFGETPFRVQQNLEEWRQPEFESQTYPRRAGISSFGAGGANAHLIVEEYVSPVTAAPHDRAPQAPVLIVLSAKNSERLQQLARNLERVLARAPQAPLRSIAFTLQLGREALAERVAFTVCDRADLMVKLARLGQGIPKEFCHGRVKRERASAASDAGGLAAGSSVAAAAIKAGDLENLAQLWVSGVEIGWEGLWVGETVRRVSLPGYAFARERYWVPVAAPAAAARGGAGQLHALVHRNESTLAEQVYGSEFSGQEVVLADHRVGGQKVLPGAAT
ncbi:MAG: SDR family NAD(P)-dependent oxidoreductase, partial [Limisphaerales bacterium]